MSARILERGILAAVLFGALMFVAGCTTTGDTVGDRPVDDREAAKANVQLGIA